MAKVAWQFNCVQRVKDKVKAYFLQITFLQNLLFEEDIALATPEIEDAPTAEDIISGDYTGENDSGDDSSTIILGDENEDKPAEETTTDSTCDSYTITTDYTTERKCGCFARYVKDGKYFGKTKKELLDIVVVFVVTLVCVIMAMFWFLMYVGKANASHDSQINE